MPAWSVAAVVGLGTAHLAAWAAGWRPVAAATKALPVLVLAGLTWSTGGTYARLLAVGLVWSAAGDVLLLSRERFAAGLGCFLVGHLCYLAAFAGGGFAPDWRWLGLLALISGGLLSVLWNAVPPRLRLPVVLYVGVISAMAWAATSRAAAPLAPSPSGTLAASGALWFLASDAILALDRFVRPVRGAHAWVMCTYYTAQTLIAASALV